ncbi:hypothetical protein LXA43DRAFT_900365, partial [Ganoderma leucocontextum]
NNLNFYYSPTAFYTMIYYFAIMEGFQLLNAYPIESGTLVQHRAQRPYDDHPHVSRVAHLKKGDLETDVVLSASKSPPEPVAAFWATQVQNILSPDFICISYPVLNESNVALLAPAQLVDTQLPSRKTLDLIRKYEARDFCFAVRPTAIQGGFCGGQSAAMCPMSVRVWPGILSKGRTGESYSEAGL